VPQHLLSLKKTGSIIDFNKTNSESEILLINSSRNSSLNKFQTIKEKLLSWNSALDGYQVVFLMEPLYLPVKKSGLLCVRIKRQM
jgi:hypothetical protein